jgi:hypothetical protein
LRNRCFAPVDLVYHISILYTMFVELSMVVPQCRHGALQRRKRNDW